MSVVVTPVGRVAYPSLVEARDNDQGSPRYQITLVWDDKVDLEKLKAAVKAVVKEKYPKSLPANFRWPWRSGSERADKEGFNETDTFIEFRRLEKFGPPACVNQSKQPLAPGEFYPGSFARVAAKPYLYDHGGNRGASLGLESVQFAGDGERIGFQNVDPDAVFDELEVTAAESDDTPW